MFDDDVDPTALQAGGQLLPAQQGLGHDEQRGRHPAVHMHFLIGDPAGFAREPPRREQPREARGSGEDLPKQRQRRIAAPARAISPISQMQALSVSRSVVATSSRRPRACSRATARDQVGVDERVDQRIERLRPQQAAV
jgi:hypothetical protein